MTEEQTVDVAEIEKRIRAEVEAEMKIRAQVESEHAPSETPEGGDFRYTGVTVMGEKEDERGNVIPNIVKSTELWGFTFGEKNYTSVPGDAIAYHSDVLNKVTRKREPTPVYVVDKLRGNSHFEERKADK